MLSYYISFVERWEGRHFHEANLKTRPSWGHLSVGGPHLFDNLWWCVKEYGFGHIVLVHVCCPLFSKKYCRKLFKSKAKSITEVIHVCDSLGVGMRIKLQAATGLDRCRSTRLNSGVQRSKFTTFANYCLAWLLKLLRQNEHITNFFYRPTFYRHVSSTL